MSARAPSVTATATTSDIGRTDDVVRRAQRGDLDAFEMLYHTHAPAVLRLCRRLSGDDSIARELLQDAFVRAWERLAQFRGESSLATWLHRLAVNGFLEWTRRAHRDAERLVDADDVELPTAPAEARLHAGMDLDAALARLPAGARAVFVLHDVEGYSHEEIARMMGVAPGTARAQAWRARRALIRILESYSTDGMR